jgi:protein-disulfide isomerase
VRGVVCGGLAANDAIRGGSEPVQVVVQQPAESEAAAQPTEPPAVVDNVSVDDDPFMGPEDAPVTIVEFSDFQCPYCERAFTDVLPQVLDTYGDQVRLVYRDFPLTQIHPQALPAAIAADCANDQGKFWEYHDLLFSNQSALDDASLKSYADQLGLDQTAFDECVSTQAPFEEIRNDYQDGVNYGVSGTPTFFINGVRVTGAQPFAVFQAIIDQALAEANAG